LIQSCNYKGRVEVTFPVHHKEMIVKPIRSIGATFRSMFYGNTRHEIEVHWPYANRHPSEDSDEEARRRKCLVRSETAWFNDWRPVLKAAIMGKKKGWVGEADFIEMMMTPPGPETAAQPWGAR
jgi:hypothetical protein